MKFRDDKMIKLVTKELVYAKLFRPHNTTVYVSVNYLTEVNKNLYRQLFRLVLK